MEQGIAEQFGTKGAPRGNAKLQEEILYAVLHTISQHPNSTTENIKQALMKYGRSEVSTVLQEAARANLISRTKGKRKSLLHEITLKGKTKLTELEETYA